MGEASDRRMLAQIEPASESPAMAPRGDDSDPESPRLPHRYESSDATAENTLRNESAAPRPPVRRDPDSLSDRNRKALEALRSLRARPPARTDEELENWIREIRLRREASTRHLAGEDRAGAGRPRQRGPGHPPRKGSSPDFALTPESPDSRIP